MANQPGCALLKTIGSPSPSSYHIPMSHQLVVEFQAHHSLLIGWDFFRWLELMKLSFILSQSLWTHMCNYLVVSRRQFSLRHLNLWHFFFCLIFPKVPWALWKRLWYVCSIYFMQSTVFFFSSHWSVRVSVFILIYCKQKILWSGLRNSLFCQ